MRSAAALAVLLAGCAATPDDGAITARFLCDRGTTLALVFLDGHAMLRAGDALPLRLEQQRVGSGFAYAGAGRSIRGKGRELQYALDGAASETCTAIDD